MRMAEHITVVFASQTSRSPRDVRLNAVAVANPAMDWKILTIISLGISDSEFLDIALWVRLSYTRLMKTKRYDYMMRRTFCIGNSWGGSRGLRGYNGVRWYARDQTPF